MRTRSRRCRLLVAAALASLTACSDPLPSPALVDKLRLLAIVAEPPEAAPDGAVSLRAVWADGAQDPPRAVYFLWRRCAPGSDRDPRACLRERDTVPLAAGLARDATEIPAALLPADPPDALATGYAVLLALCPGAPPAYDAVAGQYQCPTDASRAPSQREGIQAFRAVTVRASAPRAGNPGIARVTLDGAAVDTTAELRACPATGDCGGVALALLATAGSGPAVDPDAGATGALLASFFATAGRIAPPRAVATSAAPLGEDGALGARYFPPSQPGLVRAWVVLRDGRGGSAVRALTLTVR